MELRRRDQRSHVSRSTSLNTNSATDLPIRAIHKAHIYTVNLLRGTLVFRFDRNSRNRTMCSR
jgi:hypothetical protein